MSKVFLGIAAGPGIGLATAKRFAQEGFDIVLSARRPERLEPCAAQFEKMGAKVEVRRIDASDPLAVARLVESVGAGLEVVHYNAASLHYANSQLATRTLDDETAESIVSDLHVNAVSALTAIKAAAGPMKARRSGTVLVTGGGFAFQPSGQFLTLSVGKVALRGAVQALAEPLKEQGIHIASVVVCKYVLPDSKEAVEVAEEFWKLHAQPRDAWTFETVYAAAEYPH
jgi:short-subunit dehydrogenase